MWAIETTDTFDVWFDALDDTVNGSFYSNMKELRAQSKRDALGNYMSVYTENNSLNQESFF